MSWQVDVDRNFPLADRKHKLRGVVPHEAERLLYCDHIEERGNIYSGLHVSAIWKASLRSGSSTHTCQTTQSGTRSGISTTRSGRGERNYSSVNALSIPTGTTGTYVHQQATSSSKRHRSNAVLPGDGFVLFAVPNPAGWSFSHFEAGAYRFSGSSR